MLRLFVLLFLDPFLLSAALCPVSRAIIRGPCSPRKQRNCPTLPRGTTQCSFSWHMNETTSRSLASYARDSSNANVILLDNNFETGDLATILFTQMVAIFLLSVVSFNQLLEQNVKFMVKYLFGLASIFISKIDEMIPKLKF